MNPRKTTPHCNLYIPPYKTKYLIVSHKLLSFLANFSTLRPRERKEKSLWNNVRRPRSYPLTPNSCCKPHKARNRERECIITKVEVEEEVKKKIHWLVQYRLARGFRVFPFKFNRRH